MSPQQQRILEKIIVQHKRADNSFAIVQVQSKNRHPLFYLSSQVKELIIAHLFVESSRHQRSDNRCSFHRVQSNRLPIYDKGRLSFECALKCQCCKCKTIQKSESSCLQENKMAYFPGFSHFIVSHHVKETCTQNFSLTCRGTENDRKRPYCNFINRFVDVCVCFFNFGQPLYLRLCM